MKPIIHIWAINWGLGRDRLLDWCTRSSINMAKGRSCLHCGEDEGKSRLRRVIDLSERQHYVKYAGAGVDILLTKECAIKDAILLCWKCFSLNKRLANLARELSNRKKECSPASTSHASSGTETLPSRPTKKRKMMVSEHVNQCLFNVLITNTSF